MQLQTFRVRVIVGCICLCVSADAPKPPEPSGQIIDEARHILADMKESHYRHETHVDESAGVYDVDCSGLLCYVLRQVAAEHLAVVPSSKRHGRPLALQFYENYHWKLRTGKLHDMMIAIGRAARRRFRCRLCSSRREITQYLPHAPPLAHHSVRAVQPMMELPGQLNERGL